jgi:hypothetical protein
MFTVAAYLSPAAGAVQFLRHDPLCKKFFAISGGSGGLEEAASCSLEAGQQCTRQVQLLVYFTDQRQNSTKLFGHNRSDRLIAGKDNNFCKS